MDEYILQALIDKYFWDIVFIQLTVCGTFFYCGYIYGVKNAKKS